MAHSVIIPRRTFFYPVGNTSADLLTESLPREENLDLLLIGCGDPRSILYTVYADGAIGKRELDITFCDVEPAVIARDVLLFTLLADTNKESNAAIWDIFYHFNMSGSSLALLQDQASKLLSLSESMIQWTAGPYSKLIRPRTDHTLSDIRRFWFKYAATASFTTAQHSSMRQSVSEGVDAMLSRQGDSDISTACRSAGPLWMKISDGIASAHIKHYWTHGVVADSPTDSASIEFVNPTFFYTGLGSGFCVHYGTDPILGFHLAGVLAPIKGNPTRVSIGDLGNYAKQEFVRWSDAFRRRIASDVTFVVRPYVGDALSFCHALAGESGQCVSTWDARPVILDLENDKRVAAPTTFNVIDTSNVADHIGLINVLIACIPLLHPSPSSVLHTNTLLSSAGKTGDAFRLDHLGVDLTTFSMLLGIAPLPLMTKFTTKTSPFDMFASADADGAESPQYHQSITWKFPASGDQAALVGDEVVRLPIAVDEAKLCEVLSKLYIHMFSVEDATQLSPGSLWKSTDIIYVRASFAILLKFLKNRLSTDWDRAMAMLFDRIENDRSLCNGTGMRHHHDLCTHAHLLGVYTQDFLSPTYTDPYPTPPVLFANWRRKPSVAYIVMQIPRALFENLERMDAERVGTPALQCEVTVGKINLQNTFCSVQLAFGELVVDGTADRAIATIVEDEDGWNGKSPLVLWLPISTWLLDYDPGTTCVRLSIRPSTGPMLSLMSALGKDLVIFATDLQGQDIYVVEDRPRVRGTLSPSALSPSASRAKASPSAGLLARQNAPHISFTDERVSHITIKVDMQNKKSKQALKDGGAATGQISPCTVELVTGKGTRLQDLVRFPFPIDGKDIKLRVARKSGYVEVVARVASANPAIAEGGYSHIRRTPVVVSRGIPCAWSMNYVNLDKLPGIDLPQSKSKLEWIQPFGPTILSDRELRFQRSNDWSDTFVNLKNSIAHMMGYAIGDIDGHSRRAFSLYRQIGNGGYTFIFVNAIRIDLVAHSVLMDVCILPLTQDVMPRLSPLLQQIQAAQQHIRDIVTPDEEIKAWKSLLPAAVERCRSWSHRSDCAYLTHDIPLTLDVAESPICNCGRGKDIPDSEVMRLYSKAVPLVTRAAIGPLYAVPYLEPVGTLLKQTMRRGGDGGLETCAACGMPQEKLMSCGRCKTTKYCSQACQRVHWKKHKTTCNAVKI
ncbi:hypothetical protein BD626DRAFT_104873 [Schizophyllum amplum]|uniref:MYND-type domain-containing protein n=1 Tax=Schizophyllum amplum TaxID=97359 RepID=A0A550CSC8_9AGAR|nr:hypothetical protein BD626DRAFT_104873 [Auriculariopsis ampla]